MGTLHKTRRNTPQKRRRWTAWLGSRLRIGGAFSLLALVLFVAVGLISGEWVSRMRERDAGEALQQAAVHLARSLSTGLAERYREIGHAAQLQPLIGRRLDAAGWRGWLEQLQRSFPHYAWIGVADEHGQVLAATGGLLEGQDVSARPWFQEGLQAPWVGDVHEAKLLSQLLPQAAASEPLRLFDIAAPVADDQTRLVLGAHLNIAWAEAQRHAALASVPALADVEMRLLTADGTLLLGPQLADRPTDPRQREASPHDLMAEALAGGAQTLRWPDGQRYLTAAARIDPVGPGSLGWTVLVRQPEARALADAHAMRLRMWGFGLVGALLFGVCGWWLAGRLTAPLRQVAEAARSAADASGTIMPASLNEVDQLASALSRLLEQLRDRDLSLVQLNASLEQRVQERTESLRQANEDLSMFVRSISHDLQGPIGAMAALLRNVMRDDDALSAASRDALELLAAECDRLGALIRGLLDLGRAEQLEMSTTTVPMRALVNEVLQALGREGHIAANTRLSVGALPDGHGDAVLLRQVWHNLLGNALKFSAQAPAPCIEVNGWRDGNELVYQVQDNGVGFDPAQQHRLFGTFQRLHAASVFPGTGLGLAIVQRLVQRHGGRVWAEARGDGGARFRFTLPAGPAPAAGRADAAQPLSLGDRVS